MKKIAFLGCGKIGQHMIEYAVQNQKAQVLFAYTNAPECEEICGVPVVTEIPEDKLKELDLVVECANAVVIAENLERVLEQCDLMPFSLTAFQDDALLARGRALCEKTGHRILMPHGAILGLDGIFDGRSILSEVTVETIKHPKSLGRDDKERVVLYDGSTREATKLYPRNVNVHAALALAGIGFDRTHSRIIADPEVQTNTHKIHLLGKGIDFTIVVSSFSEGGVSGEYVPLSACGSLDRVLDNNSLLFV